LFLNRLYFDNPAIKRKVFSAMVPDRDRYMGIMYVCMHVI